MWAQAKIADVIKDEKHSPHCWALPPSLQYVGNVIHVPAIGKHCRKQWYQQCQHRNSTTRMPRRPHTCCAIQFYASQMSAFKVMTMAMPRVQQASLVVFSSPWRLILQHPHWAKKLVFAWDSPVAEKYNTLSSEPSHRKLLFQTRFTQKWVPEYHENTGAVVKGVMIPTREICVSYMSEVIFEAFISHN